MPGFPRPAAKVGNPVQSNRNERVCVDARRHGIVLARPLGRALLPAAAGTALLFVPWPAPVAGAPLLALGAALAVHAVWRWDRTRLVVTSESLLVVDGIVRRRSASVRLGGGEAVQLEQTFPGRLLGYGTLTVGALEITHVPQARRVARLVGHRGG
jgi:hypothetical protein